TCSIKKQFKKLHLMVEWAQYLFVSFRLLLMQKFPTFAPNLNVCILSLSFVVIWRQRKAFILIREKTF
ncbi:hypothetical protein, partial [Capnocytophaga sputigena]|uniref:hypothetical protein n=1 Tax=Capnocytophaga sputigena TaxID=1019 RepID=UPI0028D0F8C4